MSKHYEICEQMLEQRGYIVTDKDEKKTHAVNLDGVSIVVFYSTEGKFNVDKIQDLLGYMESKQIFRSIIVYKDSVTPVAKKIIEEITTMTIELFDFEELQYNITKHYLVPHHELAFAKGSKELKAFKVKYKDNFPVILKSDAVCKFYGFLKGDVVRVFRKNGMIMYRMVK